MAATALPPIIVALMTGVYFDLAPSPDCSAPSGAPLHCSFVPASSLDRSETERAAALLWHAPDFCGQGATPMRVTPGQQTVVLSLESAANYPCLADSAYLGRFDVTMTYQRSAAVPMTYLEPELLRLMFRRGADSALPAHADSALTQPAGAPTVNAAAAAGRGVQQLGASAGALAAAGARHDAVVFVAHSCSGDLFRTQILRRLVALGQVAVHAYGDCLRNRPQRIPRGWQHKVALFAGYKLCVAMENSAARDYVTEKLWQPLAAGCVPVYWGAPNIADFLPSRDAIVDVAALGSSAEALSAELARLLRDPAAYARKLAWRTQGAVLRPGFRHEVMLANSPNAECRLCQLLAAKRLLRAATPGNITQ